MESGKKEKRLYLNTRTNGIICLYPLMLTPGIHIPIANRKHLALLKLTMNNLQLTKNSKEFLKDNPEF